MDFFEGSPSDKESQAKEEKKQNQSLNESTTLTQLKRFALTESKHTPLHKMANRQQQQQQNEESKTEKQKKGENATQSQSFHSTLFSNKLEEEEKEISKITKECLIVLNAFKDFPVIEFTQTFTHIEKKEERAIFSHSKAKVQIHRNRFIAIINDVFTSTQFTKFKPSKSKSLLY